MRIASCLFLLVLVSGCLPSRPSQTAATIPRTEKPVTSAPITSPPIEEKPRPTSPASPPIVTRREISGISFEGIAFHSGSHRLRVIDQPGGPGSRFADARAAASSVGGIAGANAGFFTPEGSPLGKVISSGKSSGSWNASSLGAGVWFENGSGQSAIVPRGNSAATGSNAELLQAGPMLVENGRAVSGLDATKPALRVMLLWDGGQRWWLGRSSPCTLAELSTALSSGSPAPWPVRHALNLDGGRSTDLWVSGSVSSGPLNFRSLFNRPVRNFFAVVPR